MPSRQHEQRYRIRPPRPQIRRGCGPRGHSADWPLPSRSDRASPCLVKRDRSRVPRPLRHEAHLRRADGSAVAADRQEQESNRKVSSSHSARYGTPRGRGGARAGRGAGISVGTPRCRTIRSITVVSSMSTVKRRRPPHRGHASTSNPPPSRNTAARPPKPWQRREGTRHQRRPRPTAGLTPRPLDRISFPRPLGGRILHPRIATIPGRLAQHHLSAPGRPGPQHAMVEDQG